MAVMSANTIPIMSSSSRFDSETSSVLGEEVVTGAQIAGIEGGETQTGGPNVSL